MLNINQLWTKVEEYEELLRQRLALSAKAAG